MSRSHANTLLAASSESSCSKVTGEEGAWSNPKIKIQGTHSLKLQIQSQKISWSDLLSLQLWAVGHQLHGGGKSGACTASGCLLLQPGG